MSSYDFLAGCYDRLTYDVDYSAWADYIEKHFAKSPLPGLLPFAEKAVCGSGPAGGGADYSIPKVSGQRRGASRKISQDLWGRGQLGGASAVKIKSGYIEDVPRGRTR